MSSSAALEYRSVCFAYERTEVLHNVDFILPSGSMAAVVGPNGGGKSTLLKLALGLIEPGRGAVRVFGEMPRVARRRVGYVPQYLQFDEAFPVHALDVVLMGRVDAHVVGPYRRADRDTAMASLDRVHAAPLARRSFAELSGGERQRVLIAQALASDPDMLLLDEPTANVDPETERRIYEVLHELNQSMTVVAVSHNVNVVTRHASHLLCVNRTASMVPMEDLTQEKLHAVRRGDMTVLQHEASCHVLDASEVLQTPHRAASEEDIGS